LAYATGCDPHTIANSGTNTKGIPLDKAFEFVHTTNIKNLLKLVNGELFRWLIFVILPHFPVHMIEAFLAPV
jgi:hypothetical protein